MAWKSDFAIFRLKLLNFLISGGPGYRKREMEGAEVVRHGCWRNAFLRVSTFCEIAEYLKNAKTKTFLVPLTTWGLLTSAYNNNILFLIITWSLSVFSNVFDFLSLLYTCSWDSESILLAQSCYKEQVLRTSSDCVYYLWLFTLIIILKWLFP